MQQLCRRTSAAALLLLALGSTLLLPARGVRVAAGARQRGVGVVPSWPRAFTTQFNETTKIFLTKHTEGRWYYDADAGLEAVYRSNGIGDRFCGSVHPLTDTPCAHVVVGGKRYLVFPNLGECCMCCTAQQGCGILSPSWLDAAAFQGTVQMQGVEAYKWRKDGLQPNYYYASADERQVPLELDQEPNDRQTLWLDAFKPGPPPPDVFELPTGCKPRCPITSVCTIAYQRRRGA